MPPKIRVREIDTRSRADAQRFLALPFFIYGDNPHWVPPLQRDARLQLNRKRHPFFAHSDAIFLLAEDGDRPIGRLAVLDNRNFNDFNHEATAFFYLFECVDDHDTAAVLFEAGAAWASRRGLDRIFGPKGFTALDGMGLLVRGFEHRPALGVPYNPPYYADLVEGCGFEAEGESLSGYLHRRASLPAKIDEVAELVKRRRGLRIAPIRTRSDLRLYVPHLRSLYNDSLGGTSGNVPLTADEARAMTDQLLWFADPSLVKIVLKDEQPVGFLLAYPDISEALQRCGGRLFPFGWYHLLRGLRRTTWVNINGAGMVEKYRGLGGTAILFSEMARSVQQGRYVHADIVQVGTENDRMLRELRNLGIDFYKSHRLYGRQIVR
jgi:hypothetical protein